MDHTVYLTLGAYLALSLVLGPQMIDGPRRIPELSVLSSSVGKATACSADVTGFVPSGKGR